MASGRLIEVLYIMRGFTYGFNIIYNTLEEVMFVTIFVLGLVRGGLNVMSRVTQIYFTVDDTTTATNKTLEYYVMIISYINTQYHGNIKQSKVLNADLFNMFSSS